MQTFPCLQLGSILVTGTQPAFTCALMDVPPLYLSAITTCTAQRLSTCTFSSPPPPSFEVTQQQQERDRPACLFTEQPLEEAPSVTQVSLNISRCWACSWACNRVCTLRVFARAIVCFFLLLSEAANTRLTCLCISSKTKRCDRSPWSSRSSWISTGGALWDTEACTFSYTGAKRTQMSL